MASLGALARDSACFALASVLFCVAMLLGQTRHSDYGGSFFALLAFCLYGIVLVSGLARGVINPFRIVPAITMMWYIYPFIYIFMIDDAALSFPVPVLWASGANIVAAALIAFLFSYLIGAVSFTLDASTAHRLLGLAGTASVMQLCAILGGFWTYLGAAAEGVGPIISFMSFLGLFVLPIAALNAALPAHEGRAFRKWIIIGFIAAVQIAWLSVDGRRMLANVMLVSLLLYLHAALSVRKPSLRDLLSFAFSTMVISICVYVLWRYFFHVRHTHYFLQSTGHAYPGLWDIMQAMGQVDLPALDAAFAENVVMRPFIIQSVTAFEQAHLGLLWGQGLVADLLNAIPSAFGIDKSGLLVAERLWASQLGVPYNDWANTLYLDGYADFGIAGLSIYILCVWGVMKAALFIVALLSPIVRLPVLISFLVMLISVESSIGAIFAGFRNAAILCVLLLLARFARQLLPGNRAVRA
jgi:hypothetical protein